MSEGIGNTPPDAFKGDINNNEYAPEFQKELQANLEEKELSTSNQALEKLGNLKTLFNQEIVFNLPIPKNINKGWYWKADKAEQNIVKDLKEVNHYFHHARGRTLDILKSGNLKRGSLSCYPFWGFTDTEHMKENNKVVNLNDILNEIDTTFIISHSKTLDIQERIGTEQNAENYVGLYPQYAEITQNQRIKIEDSTGLIINTSSTENQEKSLENQIYQIAEIFGEIGKFPIFDMQGNLLWPKHMSYEEVKQFVAEIDAQKEHKSEN